VRPVSNLRLRRPLLGAAIGALLAMLMVPYASHRTEYWTDSSHHGRDLSKGYLPIYEIGSKEVVNVLQLMLNVFFTALVGPLPPTCPNVWRPERAGVSRSGPAGLRWILCFAKADERKGRFKFHKSG